jgi:hypothetical protein
MILPGTFVPRALERGELPAGTSPAFLVDAVLGMIEHQFLITPNDRMDQFEAESRQHAEQVVDFVLVAAQNDQPR